MDIQTCSTMTNPFSSVIRPFCAPLLYLLCLSFASAAQSSDPWIRFGDTERSGFKDRRGTTRIPAGPYRYEADTFHNIIAVEDSNMKAWYLLKNGAIAGPDSVHYFDGTPDCETEGKIRFRDLKRDKVGFFNGSGRVIIPAVYDYASPFINGLSVAYRNGRKQCAGLDTVNCEHWSWVGGQSILINDKNEVLADDLSGIDPDPDWFSMQKNQPNPDTSIWITLRGTGGNTYNFRHHERDFRHWLTDTFQPALRSDSALKSLMFVRVLYTIKTDRQAFSPARMLARLTRRSMTELFKIDSLQRIDIFRDNWYFLSGAQAAYRQFLTACGDHDQERFPGFQVVVSYFTPRRTPLTTMPPADAFNAKYELKEQRSLHFLRTAGGYKLVEISF